MRSTGVPSPMDTTPATMLARSRSDRVRGGPASGSLLWCWLRNLCVLLKTPKTTELYTAMLARGKDMPLKKPNTYGERKHENCSRVSNCPVSRAQTCPPAACRRLVGRQKARCR